MNFIKKTVIAIITGLLSISLVHADIKTNFVPGQNLSLVPKTITLDTPETFEGLDNDTWENIGNTLRTTDAQIIVLRITGYGGGGMEGNKFIRAMQDAESQGKQVIMDVIGPAYSMHAYITCFASACVIRNGASLMFHKGAVYKSALFGNISYRDTSTDPSFIALQGYWMQQCKDCGRLTDQDIQTINNGGDVTFTHEGKYIKTYYSPDSSGYQSTLADMAWVAVYIGLFLGFLRLIFRAIRYGLKGK